MVATSKMRWKQEETEEVVEDEAEAEETAEVDDKEAKTEVADVLTIKLTQLTPSLSGQTVEKEATEEVAEQDTPEEEESVE